MPQDCREQSRQIIRAAYLHSIGIQHALRSGQYRHALDQRLPLRQITVLGRIKSTSKLLRQDFRPGIGLGIEQGII